MIDEYQKIKTPNELLMFMDKINYGYLSKSSKVYLNNDGDWYLEYILENTRDILNTMTGVNVKYFCRFLVKKIVGFW